MLTTQTTINNNTCQQMQWNWVVPGLKVWIKEDVGYFPGVVTGRDQNKVRVQCQTQGSDSKAQMSLFKCFQRSLVESEFEDMCSMDILNQPQILHNLKARYMRNLIYTRIGATLISLNPYKQIEQLYSLKRLLAVRDLIRSGQSTVTLPPHVFHLAGEAYSKLKSSGRKQAIVISGESGAGKTQNTKYCMKLVISISHTQQQSVKQKALQDIILECNPILQAFGNCKTVRNSNSSRFGKYTRMFVNQDGHITGARIQNYLLEKSRVTSVNPKERSFHIFYYLLNSRRREIAGLPKGQKYHYLQASGCMHAQGVDDVNQFNNLEQALTDIGLSPESTARLWGVLGSILMLGNLNFNNEDNLKNQNNNCTYSDQTLALRISNNLKITIQQLNGVLTEQKLSIGKQFMVKHFSKEQCTINRNTLAKALYGRVFDYLVSKINEKLWLDRKSDRSISILDIFGFESFDHNSFQQLCINFANERLQKLYTKHVFEQQIQDLRKDGLGDRVKFLAPPDNKQVIQLIEKRVGLSVFSLIDQKTYLDSAKDQDIVVEMRKIKNKFLHLDPQPNRTTFMVLHSQGPVIYNVKDFKLKNQDRVTVDVQRIIDSLFPVDQGAQLEGRTLATKFDKQLRMLNQELESSELHFIRCIKPNEHKAKSIVDDRLTLEQIRYMGVLETIQIKKSIFPFQSRLGVFVDTFKSLITTDKLFYKLNPAQQVMTILKKLIPGIVADKRYCILGKQKVYLRQEYEVKLNGLLYQQIRKEDSASRVIQRQYKLSRLRRRLMSSLRLFLLRTEKLRKLVAIREFKLKFIHFRKFQMVAKILTKVINEDRLHKQKAESTQRRQKDQRLRIIKFGKVMEGITDTLIWFQIYTCFTKLKHNQCRFDMEDTLVEFESVLPEPPKPAPKLHEPKLQKSGLDQKYKDQYKTVVSTLDNPTVAFAGQLKIPKFEATPKIQRLMQVISHQDQPPPTSQERQQVNLSRDTQFDVEQDIDKILLVEIYQLEFLEFFASKLRKRRTLFGRYKVPKETLRAKTSISKSLTKLSPREEEKALQIFKLLVSIQEDNQANKICQPIQRVVGLLIQGSQALKHEVLIQILKQQNHPDQDLAIKMYQFMGIFIHIYRIEADFVKATLNWFINRLEEPSMTPKIKQHLTYLIPRLIRQLVMKQQNPVVYMPAQYQIMALVCRISISFPVFFSVGKSIVIQIQSFETFNDIKERVCQSAGLNYNRFGKEILGFSEVMSFGSEELIETPSNDSRNVWDTMAHWQLTKSKLEDGKTKSPLIILVLKIRYPFEVYPDDEQAIELVYSQCYFDLFVGRVQLQTPRMIENSACMKALNPNLAIDDLMPQWVLEHYNEQDRSQPRNAYMQQVKGLALLLKGLSRKQLHFRFIKNCQVDLLCMTTKFPTECQTKIYLKTQCVILYQKGQLKQKIGIRRINGWGVEGNCLLLMVKQTDHQRTIPIRCRYQYAQQVSAYLETGIKQLMNLRS